MSSDQLAATPSWLNGEPRDNISIHDRGLAYGDGVFETILVNATGPVLLEAHLERLFRGLKQLFIAADPDALRRELLDFLNLCGPEPKIIKYIVTRGQGGRGYGSKDTEGPNRVLSCHPAPHYPDSHFSRGIQVYPCETRLGHDPRLARIKHLNRLPQVLARAEWLDDSYQEGILRDLDGNVIEGVFSNLFIVRDGFLITPTLDRCGVEGVMASWLKTQFQTHGLRFVESTMSLDDVMQADELFFCNSVYGVWPVAQFRQRRWVPGPITGRVMGWVKEQWGL